MGEGKERDFDLSGLSEGLVQSRVEKIIIGLT